MARAHSNDLGKDRLGPLMVRLALPSIVAQIVNALYNIVDRIYIGHMGAEGDMALTGLGVCFPIIMFISALAALGGQGVVPGGHRHGRGGQRAGKFYSGQLHSVADCAGCGGYGGLSNLEGAAAIGLRRYGEHHWICLGLPFHLLVGVDLRAAGAGAELLCHRPGIFHLRHADGGDRCGHQYCPGPTVHLCV